MKELVLAGILPVLFVAPFVGARDALPGRGARRTVALAFLLQAAWVAAVHLVYPRL